MSQTVNIERPREVVRKLADFRDGLESREQMLVDVLVLAGLGAAPEDAAQLDSGTLPSEAEVEALAAKLTAFEETLPSEERRLVEALLARGGSPDADVEAHWSLIWSEYGDASWWYGEVLKCVGSGGSLDAEPAPTWYWPSRFSYNCLLPTGSDVVGT